MDDGSERGKGVKQYEQKELDEDLKTHLLPQRQPTRDAQREPQTLDEECPRSEECV